MTSKMREEELAAVTSSPATSSSKLHHHHHHHHRSSLNRTSRSGGGSSGVKKRRFGLGGVKLGVGGGRRSSSRRRLRHQQSLRRQSILNNQDPRHRRRQDSADLVTSSVTSPSVGAAASSSAAGGAKEGYQNFIQKKIQPGVRRSKSAKINSGKENRPVDKSAFFAQGASHGGGRNASEPELPFYMPSIENPEEAELTNSNVDLTNATVRPLHRSILGKDYCFEVITQNPSQTRCFGCSSDGERQAWIEKIKRAINPNLDNSKRVEHQLSLYVQEAKGLPSKKKYFCEICLDRKLCARTTSKWKADNSILWSEGFEFACLPIHEDITVHLYKDSDKKKKKDKDYIGLVNLPVKNLINSNFVEKWYNLSTPSGNNKSKAGEAMAIRLKARFLSTRVLPTEQYKTFAEYLSHNYLHLCRTLGTSLTAQQKDELAKILVSIMYATGSIREYMTELIMEEVEKVEEESLIFRENTVGTKSVEAFLRLVGMGYLHKLFGSFIEALFETSEECEVDGSRLPAHADLNKNQENLKMSCSIAMRNICDSVTYFPCELREVFSIWQQRCANRPRIGFRLVTASLFLRLLCPAILNPILFGLANQIPDPKTARSLTLVAKVIQNLANRSRFGTKEEYMQFMDKFVRERWDDMSGFVEDVSTITPNHIEKGFEGYIDLGKEFARLHSFFVDLMPNLDAATFSNLNPLPAILSGISEQLECEGNKLNTTTSQQQQQTDIKQQQQQHDRPTLNSILEDAPLCTATETIPLAQQHHLADDYEEMGSSEAAQPSLHHHASHSSIPQQGAMSNEETTSASLCQPLHFRNPIPTINQQQQQRNNNTTNKHDDVSAKPPTGIALGSHQQPLSFANPLQQIQQRRQQQHNNNNSATTTMTTNTSNNSSGKQQTDNNNMMGSVASSSSNTSSHHRNHAHLPSANHKSQQHVNPVMVIEPCVRVANVAQLKTGLNNSNKQQKAQATRRSEFPSMSLNESGDLQLATTSSNPLLPQQTAPNNRNSKYQQPATSGSSELVEPLLEQHNKLTVSGDGLVSAEVSSPTNITRLASNVQSSNAVNLQRNNKPSTSSATKRNQQTNNQQHQKQQQQHNPVTRHQSNSNNSGNGGARRSYRAGDFQPVPVSNTAVASNLAPSNSVVTTTFPPSSPEETLSPETRTAQWVLNSITTKPSSASFHETSPVAAERKTLNNTTTTNTKDSLETERLSHLEHQLLRLTTAVKNKDQQIAEMRSLEKRHERNREKLRESVENLSLQLDHKNKLLSDASSRESVLRREIHQLQSALKRRDQQIIDRDETISHLQERIMTSQQQQHVEDQRHHHHRGYSSGNPLIMTSSPPPLSSSSSS